MPPGRDGGSRAEEAGPSVPRTHSRGSGRSAPLPRMAPAHPSHQPIPLGPVCPWGSLADPLLWVASGPTASWDTDCLHLCHLHPQAHWWSQLPIQVPGCPARGLATQALHPWWGCLPARWTVLVSRSFSECGRRGQWPGSPES